MSDLPLPPLAMRESVGPTDPAAFDNPTGQPVFPQLPVEAYDSVFDFGCGCGRLARQMIQQSPRPSRYLGVDLNKPLIDWAQENLAPHAEGFEFGHHDVRYDPWNPGEDKPPTAPFPTGDNSRSLVIGWSVFTHLLQAHAEYYMSEVARVLTPEGIFYGTWFLFDKAYYPMMQDFQDALFINDFDPTNAVIFDRNWLIDTAAENGLVISAAQPPAVRGFQWQITMEPLAKGVQSIELPQDEAPFSLDGVRAAATAPRFDSDE